MAVQKVIILYTMAGETNHTHTHTHTHTYIHIHNIFLIILDLFIVFILSTIIGFFFFVFPCVRAIPNLTIAPPPFSFPIVFFVRCSNFLAVECYCV